MILHQSLVSCNDSHMEETIRMRERDRQTEKHFLFLHYIQDSYSLLIQKILFFEVKRWEREEEL